jgi:hypothetical protein
MITLEARCNSGHYFAAVVPTTESENRTRYQVLVFLQGYEVYQETEQTLEQAIQPPKPTWIGGQDKILIANKMSREGGSANVYTDCGMPGKKGKD